MAFAAPILPFLAAAGSIIGGVGAIQAGNYQAAVARNNAKIAEQNAEAESAAAQQEASRRDRDNAQELAALISAQAASGLATTSRSFVGSRALQTRIGREERADIVRGGTSAARRQLQEAANFRASGSQARRQGIITGIGKFTQAGGSLINRRGN